MYRLITVFTICATMLMGIGLGVGLTHSRAADAKEPTAVASDPDAVFRAFVSALNNGDQAGAAALLDDDVTFFEPNGDGSFGIVGKAAFESVLSDITSSGFEGTIKSAQVHGDTVTGVVATTDDSIKAAGVDRYLEQFTVRVVDGKIASFDFLYDLSDAQTRKFIEHARASNEDEGPPPGALEVPLGAGASGSQPGSATVFEATAFGGAAGVTFIGVRVQPGPLGAQQAAELVSGSCDAPGETVYPLAAVIDGGSFTIISASVDELLMQGLSLQVHQANQTDRVNACGALAAPQAPAPPAPAPPIKPPATGTGPTPGGVLPESLLVTIVATGVLAIAAGVGVRRRQPR